MEGLYCPGPRLPSESESIEKPTPHVLFARGLVKLALSVANYQKLPQRLFFYYSVGVKQDVETCLYIGNYFSAFET